MELSSHYIDALIYIASLRVSPDIMTQHEHIETGMEGLLEFVEEALDHGDANTALHLCYQLLEIAPNHTEALFLVGEAFRELRELSEAEHRYRKVIAINPKHSRSWSALAAVLFDQLRCNEAQISIARAIRLDPLNPEAIYVRALLRERRGDYWGAERDYIRATAINATAYPRPVRLSDDIIEEWVQEAVMQLNPTLVAYLSQITVLLDDLPTVDTCTRYEPMAPPAEILGYFSGSSFHEKTLESPWSNLPTAIVLFRRNIERLAADKERTIEELRLTLSHEVRHFLGFEEIDLLLPWQR